MQSAAAGWRKKKGGGSFLCAVLVLSAAVNTARRLSPTTPPGMNIDDACTEKGMCSVAYSSTTHRPYTVPMNIPRNCTRSTRSPTQKGGRTGLGVVVHSTVYVYASMEYSVVWYSGLQRWLRSALRPAKMAALGAQKSCAVHLDQGPRSRPRVMCSTYLAYTFVLAYICMGFQRTS